MKMGASLGLIIYPRVLGKHWIKPYVLGFKFCFFLIAFGNSTWFHPKLLKLPWILVRKGTDAQVVAHTYNSSVQKIGAGGLWVGGLPQLHSESLLGKSREEMVLPSASSPGTCCRNHQSSDFQLGLFHVTDQEVSVRFSHQSHLPDCSFRKGQHKDCTEMLPTEWGTPPPSNKTFNRAPSHSVAERAAWDPSVL